VNIQPFLRQDFCVQLTARVVGLGSVIAALEMLMMRQEWSEQGVFSWSVARTGLRFAIRNGFIPIFDMICAYPQYVVLQVAVQTFCGVALALNLWPHLEVPLLVSILCVHLLTMLRTHGTDGADQMQTMLLVSLIAYCAVPDVIARKAALWFITLQVVLAYTMAGISKLWSRAWRTGTVLKQSLSLAPGNETLYRLLPDRGFTNGILCWSVVLFETSFATVLLFQPSIALIFLAFGFLMHLGNAVALGLPRFLFTFVAAYPLILSCLCDLHGAR
jgi:hypothetical protein